MSYDKQRPMLFLQQVQKSSDEAQKKHLLMTKNNQFLNNIFKNVTG